MKNYVDVKVSVWQRFYFRENEDMDKIIKIIKEEGDQVMYNTDLDFVESEILIDTIEPITPDYNHSYSTIEVYKDSPNPVYTNGN